MRHLFKWIGRMIILFILAIAGLVLFGPRENVDLSASFDPENFGGDLDAYFAAQEGQFDDLTPGTEKRVIWAGDAGVQTPVSVLYIHGFSATSEEIRPVPDILAQGLGANLIYTRLSGHGRSGAAMAEPTAGDWMHDTAEALAAARLIGAQVIIVSTSTGGTLMAAAALREDLMENVAGAIFVSPNFAINNPAAALLTLPAVRWWGPVVAGETRSFDVANERHGTYWTNSYPTVATLPMAALVKHVDALDLSAAQVPALFMFSEEDRVVSPQKTRETAGEWGAQAELFIAELTEGDDPWNHVIAGDILSPGMTQTVSAKMTDWARQVLNN